MKKGDRIKALREACNLSQVELADLIGVSKQTLYKYENGIITNIPSDKIEAIAKHTHSSAPYIMGWEDKSYSNIRKIGVQTFPVLGKIACGKPVFMNEEKDVYVDITTGIKADYILIASGDSMTGARINDGDLVFIHEQPTVENGEIAAVAIGDEATLKRVYYYADKAMLILKAANPAYEDMIYSDKELEDVHILGKAVAFQSDVK